MNPYAWEQDDEPEDTTCPICGSDAGNPHDPDVHLLASAADLLAALKALLAAPMELVHGVPTIQRSEDVIAQCDAAIKKAEAR